MALTEPQTRGGLRFEVYERPHDGPPHDHDHLTWHWRLVGKDGVVCESPWQGFSSDVEARSHIHRNKGRLKASGYAKVINVQE